MTENSTKTEDFEIEEYAVRAGEFIDVGQNCAQAVLQAVTGRSDEEFLAMTEGFGGGIGDTGCVCGAVVGGVMALGLAGQADRADRLMESFKKTFRTTCCKGLTNDYEWMSMEHYAHCRQLVQTTTKIVDKLLKE